MDIVIGIVAGIFTMCGIIPQIYKAHKTKKVKDVSRWMLIIIMIGVLLWVIYGFIKNDLPIILTNAIALLLNGYMYYLTLKFERKKS